MTVSAKNSTPKLKTHHCVYSAAGRCSKCGAHRPPDFAVSGSTMAALTVKI